LGGSIEDEKKYYGNPHGHKFSLFDPGENWESIEDYDTFCPVEDIQRRACELQLEKEKDQKLGIKSKITASYITMMTRPWIEDPFGEDARRVTLRDIKNGKDKTERDDPYGLNVTP